MKLEKGYEFGDVLLDGTLPNISNCVDSKGKILSTSMFTPVKDNRQRVCVVAKQETIEKYKQYSSGSNSCRQNKEQDNANVKNDNTSNLEIDEKQENTDSLQTDEEKAIGKEITFESAETNKETLTKACSHCFNNNLTLCHLDLSQKMLKLSKNTENELGKHNADFTDKSFNPETSSDKEDIEEERRLVKKVRKMTKRLWSHTSKNGLFITVWPGTKSQNAFVGIAINKASI